MFPSLLLSYNSHRLSTVRINSLGSWRVIICLVFYLVGCVLDRQQLR